MTSFARTDRRERAQEMQAGDLVEMASVRSHTQGSGGSARVATHKEMVSVRVTARNMKCCGSVMVSKEAASATWSGATQDLDWTFHLVAKIWLRKISNI